MDKLNQLKSFMEQFPSAPSNEDMPRLTLPAKGIYGPTAAHFIEEIHTPFNLAYTTFTTGSTAFQNIVGVAHNELDSRAAASLLALEKCGAKRGDTMLFAYPPLVNVFYYKALEDYGLSWHFLERSQREALILSLCENAPNILVGESSFIRATIEDGVKAGLLDCFPRDVIVLAAGTPLDLELAQRAKALNWQIYDLYGAQEFGWLTLNGMPLRDDISLIENHNGHFALVVGGLPTGDTFPVTESGEIITYKRVRTEPEFVVCVEATTAASGETIGRLAKTILRIKGKIVMVSPQLETGCEYTRLKLLPFVLDGADKGIVVEGPVKTRMFDCLLAAQLDYQSQSKKDPTWIKTR